jgi:hypothetical protein
MPNLFAKLMEMLCLGPEVFVIIYNYIDGTH